MFKINLFYPIEYRQRIRNNMTLKIKVKIILNQWHLKTIEWAISDSLWICESNRWSICNFTRPWLYLHVTYYVPLPICINCRALAWDGVYVYKLAFFFWLSPRTYHFLFEKTTDNRLAVLLTKYRTIVDFRTENECHQTTPLRIRYVYKYKSSTIPLILVTGYNLNFFYNKICNTMINYCTKNYQTNWWKRCLQK